MAKYSKDLHVDNQYKGNSKGKIKCKCADKRSKRLLFRRVMALMFAIAMVLNLNVFGLFRGEEEIKVQAETGSNIKTVYFDTIGLGVGWGETNGWSENGPIYIYCFKNGTSDNSGIKKMEESSKKNTLTPSSTAKVYEYEVNIDLYDTIIFVANASWGAEASQTVDISLTSGDAANYSRPLYRWDSNDGAKKTVKLLGNLSTESHAGETIYFYDMTNSYDTIKAVFCGDDIDDNEISLDETNGVFTITIPEDAGTTDKTPYRKVYFTDSGGNKLGSTYVFEDAVANGETGITLKEDVTDAFYYGINKSSNGTMTSIWSSNRENITDDDLKGKILYFDRNYFPCTSTISVIVGSEEITLTNSDVVTKDGKSYYKYLVPEDNDATRKKTVLGVKKSDGTIYKFYWDDKESDYVTLKTKDTVQVAVVDGLYSIVTATDRTIYFDATLSKLVYSEIESGKYGIPNKSGTIRYYATGDGKSDKEGDMTLVPIYTTDDGHTYADVYSVTLPVGYTKIVFSSYDMNNINDLKSHGESTGILDIPAKYEKPCFYADTSDDYVYDRGQRGGYWDKVYTVRDPENEDGSVSNEIVTIPNEDFKKETDKLYVNTTFFDYYSDYELNGLNRADYPIDYEYTHRLNHPFRQFNQALSEYYKNDKTTSSLYWGNFERSNPSFSGIKDSLGLYVNQSSGENYDNELYYENNSIWDKTGSGIGASNATQGLVSDTLSDDGKLMMNTSDGKIVEAPFFDKNFMNGNNSKNTILGKVYEGVEFPFRKDDDNMYWVFDSTQDILRMKEDKSGKYYLKYYSSAESSTNGVHGSIGGGATGSTNFFPFNDKGQSGKYGKLNYGFGAKIDINFRLTDNGKVKNSDGQEVPIEFNFSGDDDIWIFVDGKLVLDIGGDHGIVTGYLKFASESSNEDKKTWYVSGVKNPNGNGTLGSQTGEFTLNGANTEEHTLTVFYMERGLLESNMNMSFSFPDDNYFEVEKQVDKSDVNPLFDTVIDRYKAELYIKNYATHYGAMDVNSAPDQTDSFAIRQDYISDYGSIAAKKLMAATGAKYISHYNEITTDNKKLGNNGSLLLLSGESALFKNQFRRGSYISLSEKEEVFFDTTWSVYEKGKLVDHISGGDSVTITDTGPLKDIASQAVDDGRTESYQTGTDSNGQMISNNGYTSAQKPEESTIVFKSYQSPDSMVAGTNIKVVYTNKVKTGSITINKTQAYPTDAISGDFVFMITFSNVGGIDLEGEDNISTTIILQNGGSETIEGIPLGTEFTIIETAEDGSILHSVVETTGRTFDINGNTISGTMMGQDVGDDGNTSNELYDYNFTFKNTKKPVVQVSVSKQWKKFDNSTLTEGMWTEVMIMLQKKQAGQDDSSYTQVDITGDANVDNDDVYIITSGNAWQYTFIGLDKYVDYTVSQENLVLWEYRVVEVRNEVVLEDNDSVDGFEVSYIHSKSGDNFLSTITNMQIPKTNVVITKVDATDNSIKLDGVKFTLERLQNNGLVDTSFEAITLTTGGLGNEAGKVSFTDLDEGMYRLTEIETLSDYTLLKSPVIIVINRRDGTSRVNGVEKNVINDVLELTVANQKAFVFPPTGGIGSDKVMMLGLLLMLVANFMLISGLLVSLKKGSDSS